MSDGLAIDETDGHTVTVLSLLMISGTDKVNQSIETY